MKVTIEIDCTPEEARRTMGLPDLKPLHDRYLRAMDEAMTRAMDGATDSQILRPEMLEAMIKSWAPMGEAGLGLWRRMVEGAGKPG